MREREFAALIQSLDQVLVGFLERALTRKDDRIRYPDPVIKVNDTVKISLKDGKIEDFIRFDTGVIAMATGGRNMGRVGVITHRERHDGGFNIVHIKDAIDNSFATRESNVFVIGREKPWISLPKGKGVKVRSRSVILNENSVADGTDVAVNCGRERSSSCLCNCWPLSHLRLGSAWKHDEGKGAAYAGIRNYSAKMIEISKSMFKSLPSMLTSHRSWWGATPLQLLPRTLHHLIFAEESC